MVVLALTIFHFMLQLITILNRCHRFPGFVYQQAGFSSEQYYDIVVADSIMPEMNGIEFFKQAVLRDPRLAERFLFLTDFNADEHIDFAKKNNIRYLTKPFLLDEIREAVHGLLAKTPVKSPL